MVQILRTNKFETIKLAGENHESDIELRIMEIFEDFTIYLTIFMV